MLRLKAGLVLLALLAAVLALIAGLVWLTVEFWPTLLVLGLWVLWRRWTGRPAFPELWRLNPGRPWDSSASSAEKQTGSQAGP